MDRDRVRSFALRVLCCGAMLVVAASGAARASVNVGPFIDRGPRCDATHIAQSLCGPVTVPLDRGGRVPGAMRLRVQGWPRDRGWRTVLVLDGTAAGRATQRLADYSFELRALGARQVVTFNMRGTGASRLDCPALREEQSRSRAVAECAAQLGTRRAFFTVMDDVADAEAVRAALGIERMTIYGFDYGARVAAAYASAHPDHVERLVLDSPEPLDGPDPSGHTTFAAIRRVLSSVCTSSCRFTHDARGELARLLRHVPLHARAFDGRGRAHAVVIGAAQVRDVLLAGDASVLVRMMWPSAVHAALHGDPALLARLVRAAARTAPLRGAGGALRLARMCGGRTTTPANGQPTMPIDAFAPFSPRLAAEVSPDGICAAWPDPPSAVAVVPPAVPVLVRSGEDALGTPLEDAQALADRIPGAQLLTLPLVGHEILGWSVDTLHACPQNALRAFGRGEPVRACRQPRARFVWALAPPRNLAAVSPSRGLRGDVGRTVRAVQLTLLDAVTTLFDLALIDGAGMPTPRQGGLNGGYERFSARGWTLHRYSYVPGVTLSGVIATDEDDNDSLVLRVGGRAAVHGTLRAGACGGEQTCLVGRLGGRRVHVPIPGSG